MGGFSPVHWVLLIGVAVVLFGGAGRLSGLMGDAAKGIKYSLAHHLTDIQDVLLGGIRLETSPPSGPLGIPQKIEEWDKEIEGLVHEVQAKDAQQGACEVHAPKTEAVHA